MPSIWTIIGLNASAFFLSAEKVKMESAELGAHIGSHLGGKLAGLFAVSAIEGYAEHLIELGSKVSDISSRLGISTEAVQRWDYALKQNGSSIEEAVPFFQKLGIARKKALEGDSSAIQDFQKLGVSFSQLKSMRLEDVATTIAKGFEEGDPQQLMAPLIAVGGRGAGAMAAAFRDGLVEAMGEASIVSEKDIAELKAAGDAITKLKNESVSFFGPAVAAIATFFKDFMETAEASLGWFVGAFNGAVENVSKLGWRDFFNGKAQKQLGKGIVEGGLEGWHAMADKFEAQDKAAEAKLKLLAGGNKTPFDPEDELGKATEKEAEAREKKDRERQDRLNGLQEQLKAKEAEISLIGLDSDEKRIELTKQRAEILKDILAMQGEAYDGIDMAEDIGKAKLKGAEKNKELLSLDEKDREANANLGKHSVNSLQQMGGFLGNVDLAAGPETAAMNAQIQSRDLLMSIDKNIEAMAAQANTSENGGVQY